LKTYKEFAEMLNTKILLAIQAQAPIDMGAFLSYQFVTYEEVTATTGKIIINSTTIGLDSKVEICALTEPGTLDLYHLLEIDVKIYRPAEESGLVFLTGNNYDYSSNLIDFKINSSDIDQEKKITTFPAQNTSVADGPTQTIILTDENADDLTQILDNSNINVYAMASDNLTIIDHLVIAGVTKNKTYGTLGEHSRKDGASTIGVFKDNNKSFYDYTSSTLSLNFVDGIQDTAVYDQSFPVISKITVTEVLDLGNQTYQDVGGTTQEFLEVGGAWTQNPLVQTGPSVSLTGLTLVLTKNYRVRVYSMVNSVETIVDWFIFLNIANTENPTSNNNTSGQTVDYTSLVILDYPNTEITFKCNDGTINPDINSFLAGWDEYDSLKIVYQRKNYEFITINYKPNIYKCERDAATLQSVLMKKSTRMISLEHVFKRVNFVPFKVQLLLTIKKTFSLSAATNKVKELLIQNLKFNNLNNFSDINTVPSEQEFKNILSDNLSTYGIKKITILNDLNFTLDGATYFFMLEDDIISRMETLEKNYTNLVGLSNLYKTDITAVYE
jgi:hypothetical protein